MKLDNYTGLSEPVKKNIAAIWHIRDENRDNILSPENVVNLLVLRMAAFIAPLFIIAGLFCQYLYAKNYPFAYAGITIPVLVAYYFIAIYINLIIRVALAQIEKMVAFSEWALDIWQGEKGALFWYYLGIYSLICLLLLANNYYLLAFSVLIAICFFQVYFFLIKKIVQEYIDKVDSMTRGT